MYSSSLAFPTAFSKIFEARNINHVFPKAWIREESFVSVRIWSQEIKKLNNKCLSKWGLFFSCNENPDKATRDWCHLPRGSKKTQPPSTNLFWHYEHVAFVLLVIKWLLHPLRLCLHSKKIKEEKVKNQGVCQLSWSQFFRKTIALKTASPFHWQELGHNAKQSGKVSILVVHNQPKENWYSASNNEEKNGYWQGHKVPTMGRYDCGST